jgi:hypothetical protein
MLYSKMKEKHRLFFIIISTAIVMTSVIFLGEKDAAADWIYYDEGTADNASSDFQYQGVRFSLPDDVVAAPLLTLTFYYKNNSAGACPVTIHITGADHVTDLVPPVDCTAVDGWNELDISDLGLAAPHNFYIILEKHDCEYPSGYLLMDTGPSSERSFKGKFLQSSNTRLSYNLLIRAEVGPPLSIPLFKQWNMEVTEKLKVRIKHHSETVPNSYSERWTLYADGQFDTENYVYGMWKHKGKKYIVFLDPEDIRNEIWDIMDNISFDEVTDVIVTKSSFTWIEKKDRSIKGKYRAYASINFQNSSFATITINRTFKGTSDQ